MELFHKVKCRAYLKKVSDGVHIIISDPNGRVYEHNSVAISDFGKVKAEACRLTENFETEVIADLSNFEGETVEKTYRRRVEETFTGFIVGVTHVKVKGVIGTDWRSDEYYEHGYCFKETTDQPKVAVVYFKNNCKRYVLLDDIESEAEND